MWFIPAGAPAHETVKEERGSERCGCFLNSIRGNNKSLSNTHQLTSCHLPRKRWRWWGGWGMQGEDRAFWPKRTLSCLNIALRGAEEGAHWQRERRRKRKDRITVRFHSGYLHFHSSKGFLLLFRPALISPEMLRNPPKAVVD